MMNINTSLLSSFIRLRLINGIPSRREIVQSILRTSTRSIFPDGWEFR